MTAVTGRQRVVFMAILIAIGAGWGLTQPLAKIAVSTGHGQFGLIFWQLMISVLILGALTALRGKRLPVRRRYWARYVVIACIGTIIPNSFSYMAAYHLPSGVMSIMISLVPMFALPIALALGQERFDPLRVVGVLCGAAAVVLIAGPDSSLPDRSMAIWVLIACIAPLMYGMEGNLVARFGILDLDAMQLLLGASVVGIFLSLPLALATGQFIDPRAGMGGPEWALVGSSVMHALVYSGYVWLVGRAGAVFSSQVSYVVTGSGVLWAMLILSERYSAWVWLAFVVMLGGLFLVQPRAAHRARTPVAEQP